MLKMNRRISNHVIKQELDLLKSGKKIVINTQFVKNGEIEFVKIIGNRIDASYKLDEIAHLLVKVWNCAKNYKLNLKITLETEPPKKVTLETEQHNIKYPMVPISQQHSLIEETLMKLQKLHMPSLEQSFDELKRNILSFQYNVKKADKREGIKHKKQKVAFSRVDIDQILGKRAGRNIMTRRGKIDRKRGKRF